ncbi:hypothetical protein V6R21_31085 [Limibacter armeniacum]|uniref:hypothetical protein n=1 Tax=Limibacter armeniacum TaxID=466084 RepID=UPI002FE50681
MKFNFISELVYLLKSAVIYTAAYTGIMYWLDEEMTLANYLQGMMVILLVAYIVRVIFKVMNSLK